MFCVEFKNRFATMRDCGKKVELLFLLLPAAPQNTCGLGFRSFWSNLRVRLW